MTNPCTSLPTNTHSQPIPVVRRHHHRPKPRRKRPIPPPRHPGVCPRRRPLRVRCYRSSQSLSAHTALIQSSQQLPPHEHLSTSHPRIHQSPFAFAFTKSLRKSTCNTCTKSCKSPKSIVRGFCGVPAHIRLDFKRQTSQM